MIALCLPSTPALTCPSPRAQQQSRLKQNQQQELLRQMRPDGMQMTPQQQQYMMRNMPNGQMAMKPGNLARAAMANNQK